MAGSRLACVRKRHLYAAMGSACMLESPLAKARGSAAAVMHA